jgi:hypothetical protein
VWQMVSHWLLASRQRRAMVASATVHLTPDSFVIRGLDRLPRSVGGLDRGHGPVALVLTLAIIGFVAYLASTRKDVEDESDVPRSRRPARHRRGLAVMADEFRPRPPSGQILSGRGMLDVDQQTAAQGKGWFLWDEQ